LKWGAVILVPNNSLISGYGNRGNGYGNCGKNGAERVLLIADVVAPAEFFANGIEKRNVL
jgi:hypothetical protein